MPPAAAGIQIEHVAPSALSPADYNPRTMTAEARKRLARSLREFGVVDPIIARRSDNLVIGGHQRLVAAQELGLATVPVVYLDDIDDARAAALNVALNNPAEAGAWDLPKLGELLATLDAGGLDLTLTGFDGDELARLMAGMPDIGLASDVEGSVGSGDQWICAVTCESEGQLAKLYDRLKSEGYACKLIT